MVPSTGLTTRLRQRLYVLALGTWLLVMCILLIRSYYIEKQDVYEHLSFQTEPAFIQFQRHWPSIAQQSRVEKDQYFNQLSKYFNPHLHFSVLSTSGKVLASSLNNLNQLSYGPVIKQFENSYSVGQQCINELNALQKNSVQACAMPYKDKILFVASVHDSAIFNYWLSEKKYFILACLFSLILFAFFLFLNHRQKLDSKNNYQILKNNIVKQDNNFKRLVSNLPGILYRLNLKDQSLNFISSGCLHLLGYPPDYFLKNNITPFDLIDKEDKDNFLQTSKSAHFSLKPFEMIYRIKTASGEHKWILDRGRCFQESNNELYIEGVMLDITERELVSQQIEYLSIQDPLTELYNRFKFNDELVQAVSHSKIHNERFAILFIDLDRFKNINDSLGHQLGDRLLQKVAQRLQHILPKQHFLARMGGDEFVVLMRDIKNIKDIEILADDINRHIRQVFRVDSYELRTSCSIGISICPDHSDHSHILWRYADTAMYQVKNRGGDNYQFFTQEIGDMVQHRINIENSFIPAFNDNQFELYYQPQVDIHTNKILGSEALIRWFHPELGAISPDEFIPIAEETGFIHTLGDWILEQSILQLKSWLVQNPNFIMSVNVSAIQITNEFPEKIKKLLSKHQIDGESLELEITESLLMENIEFILPLLNETRKLGVGFAIDDFGTGYSSLSYLRYLPINKLKIDRAFVMNIESNNDDVNLIKAIIAMSKSLNLIVLAEGIENQSQLDLLKGLACERYQGYYFNKPLDSRTFTLLYMEPKEQT